MSLGLRSQRPIVPPTQPPPSTNLTTPSFPTRRLHLAAAAVHALIAIVVVSAGNRDLVVQLFVFPTETLNRIEGDWIIRPTSPAVPAGQLHIIGTIAFFEAVTAFFHLLNAVAWPHYYAEQLAKCRAPTRWIEYSITAPVMIVLLGIFSGVVHLYTLIALFGLTQVTMFFGYLVERVSTPSITGWVETRAERLSVHFLGWPPLLFAWGIIIAQFVRYSNAVGRDPNGQVLNRMPEWVYAIFIGEIFMFWSFAAVQLYVILKPPSVYLVGERAYVILSFVSKATLSLIIFGGTLNLAIDNRP